MSNLADPPLAAAPTHGVLLDTDVAVIGGGVIGCSVAYYLAKAGARVAVLERAVVGAGASSVNSGVVSLATKKPGLALDLAQASQRLYPELGRELGADLEYVADGGMVIAETETEAAYLEEMAAAQQAAGVPLRVLDAAECRKLNPLLEARILTGVYCPTDAQANPFKVTQAFANAAHANGTVVLTGIDVQGIETAGDRVTGVRTSRGLVRARWVINAAGARAGEIGAMVGVPHDIVPRRGQMIVLEAADAMPPMRVGSAGALLAKHKGAAGSINAAFAYTSKPISGTVLLGGTNEFAGFDSRTTQEALAEISRLAVRAMPEIGRLQAIRAWAGLRPYSPKGPILGHAGGPRGYAAAIGHGGDGVALSPITGVYLAEYIARDGQDEGLPAFLAKRKALVTA